MLYLCIFILNALFFKFQIEKGHMRFRGFTSTVKGYLIVFLVAKCFIHVHNIVKNSLFI